MNKKLGFILLFCFALIGLSSGWNYYILSPENDFSLCGEFGFCALMRGEDFLPILSALALSTAKNFALIFCAVFFRPLIAVSLFSLFTLSFRLGALCSLILHTLGAVGILESAVTVLFALFVVICACLLCYAIMCRYTFVQKAHRFTREDARFAVFSASGALAFFTVCLILLAAFRFSNNFVRGFFNYYL